MYKLFFCPTNFSLDSSRLLVGDSGIDKLKNAHVVVVGVGGVGGYTVEALARAGIGHLTVVDNDTVDITNLNRQIIALRSTVGMHKIDVIRARIIDINPDCNVVPIKRFFMKDDDLTALGISKPEDVSFIVDACDAIDSKLRLITLCSSLRIPLITCTGAARKMDPTKIEIRTLKKTSVDKLALMIRQKLKAQQNYRALQTVAVFSTELPCEMPDFGSKLESVSKQTTDEISEIECIP